MWRLFPLVLMLCGCGMPGAYFSGMPVTRVSVDDITFEVRVRRDLAEAWRVGPALALRAGPFFDPAQVAMEVVSGCRVARIGGDQVQFTGILDCPAIDTAPPLSSAFTCTAQKGQITCRGPRD